MRTTGLPRHLVARARRRQRRLAVLAIALWVIGVEVAPGVHLWWHDHLAHHDHHDGARPSAPAGPRIVVHTGAGHAHDGQWHDHAAAPPTTAAPATTAALTAAAGPAGHLPILQPPGEPARHHGDPGHGAGSLAHHQLALAAPAPAVIAPLPVERHATLIALTASRSLVAAAPPIAGARGPPDPTHPQV